MAASVSSGVMADVFEKKSLWAKAWILCLGQLLSVPLMMLTCAATGNFWLSIGAYALYHFVASTYAGPAITMMQNTAPPAQQGNVVSAYFFIITIGQTIAPAIFDVLAGRFGAFANPKVYGPLIAGFTAFSYCLSIPFWWKAGKHYVDEMKKKQKADSLTTSGL